MSVIRNLIRHTAVKNGFFETLHLSLTYINRLSLAALRDVLAKHGIQEADKMKDIKPKLIQSVRQSI